METNAMISVIVAASTMSVPTSKTPGITMKQVPTTASVETNVGTKVEETAKANAEASAKAARRTEVLKKISGRVG